jgi:bis(5'-nucleosidyl)-tetraphosphatase
MKTQKKKARSAGFIIVRKTADGWEVLGLRVWGKIDIPKGHLEEGESDFDAALRETEEESGIIVNPNRDMIWGNVSCLLERPHKDVRIFLAKTENEPVITRNPETKRYEHDGYHWLSWRDMKRRCYPYLVEAVNWAQTTIEKAG